jgi:Fic family protein
MGTFIDREWRSRFAGGFSRPENRGGTYAAYLPDPLVGRPFTFDAPVAADIADAERHINRLDIEAIALGDTESLARLLLRAESVASSKIEGLTVSAQRLLRADVARSAGEAPNDPTALDVLHNVDAMSHAMSEDGIEISVERLREFHRRLLASTTMGAGAGRLRTEQNWIGGTSFNPFGAAFVPPPSEAVPALLEDLCLFCNDDALPAVAQAAIAHAQFETIHPFVDGNGRTGRALIHMIFKRRGLMTRTLPPVSLILATHARDYTAALQATRFEGPPTSPPAMEATNRWVALFAWACSRAVADAQAFERRVAALQAAWRERVGPVRADASILALIHRLSSMPLVTARSVERALGISFQAANTAIARLETAGILTKTRVGRRNRAFEARELVDAYTDFERRVATIDGDTRVSDPARNVPKRPAR